MISANLPRRSAHGGHHPQIALLAAAFLVPASLALRAQGTLETVTFRTGTNGPVLQTHTVSVAAVSAGTPLSFDFGFASAEKPGPGPIFDSFSIALQGLPGVSQLVTVDANGAVWVPQTPGTVTVPRDAVSWQQTQFRLAAEAMDVYGAYAFTFSVPEVWAGHALSFHFDVFDNANDLGSLAYGGIAVVPEPHVISLVLMALAAGSYLRMRQRPL